ncbi:MAG: guanosine polyphosphate pyrophosphohydrolase [Lachnospiraceae bacterium]|nr:guanosine polyphosphate pyrophosphohydrolase [Lachnospiraceae bacterium]
MITVNDYLYSGDTVLKILQRYYSDLKEDARQTKNGVDLIHCNFLLQQMELLEHNDFLTSQSQRIREFYKYMTGEYPYLAFTFKGRIKSLIRSEQKFNGNVVEHAYDYYQKHGTCPSVALLKSQMGYVRDLIAYRIVISMPACHLRQGEDREEMELKYLYEIANILPGFLEEEGFSAETSGMDGTLVSDRIEESVRPYYRDYVEHPSTFGYRSLHITFYDNQSRSYFEVQLRTKQMDDYAEIGPAHHLGYEKRQEKERTRRDLIPVGECTYFDEAYERGILLQGLDLSKVDVNMFGAVNNQLINDGCGLYRGRLILPYEHLSRFQNDLID